MLPLLTADLLTHAIVGSVLENLDMERLVREVGEAVAQRILGNNESVDDVARELHEKLMPIFAYHSANPGTKVVHLQTASADITAVMATIRLPIRTCLAPQRKSVGVALEHVLGIVFLDPRRRRHPTLQYTLMVQSDRFLVIGYRRASA